VITKEKILILDFGSQYTQLIARRVRELGVYSELHSFNISIEAIKKIAPKGIILSGGPASVYEENSPRVAQEIFDLGIPIFGICYGMQTMAVQLGGSVEGSAKKEFGHTEITLETSSALFKNIAQKNSVWMSHGDKVVKLPKDFVCIASSDNAEIVAMSNEAKHWYGVQFHPEVTHTDHGDVMLSHFLYAICHCERQWAVNNIIEDIVAKIRSMVKNESVILALSGGVDSSVLAALLQRAIGDQLTCIFVDNGLLRLNEADQVMALLSEELKVKIKCVDAKAQFLKALKGESDPEAKRKIIGAEFINVFDAESKKLKDIQWLAQGTIYPDVIESSGHDGAKSKVIKSHHNVGGLPEKMNLKLLEPLRELFKDEVRNIGIALGLPKSMIYRHPFPGTGLSVRVLGEVKAEYLEIVRHADFIFIEELRSANLYDSVSQAFAVFLPVKSVGVVGDNRQYEYVISLRAVETIDFMTARSVELPYSFLKKVSARILNEVPHVSRVVYDISDKPPATIEWE
jgi:GMP synthase (glutamine-hydrolysing)